MIGIHTKVVVVSAVVVAAVLGTVSNASAGMKAPSATNRILARAAVGVAESLFGADADAQINGGNAVSSSDTSGAATGQFVALVARDRAAAQFTASLGFSWDAHVTKVSLVSVAAQGTTSAQAVVDVENDFHIAGAPNDGSLTNESITIDRYAIQFAQAGSRSHVLSFALQQPPSAAAALSPGLQLAPPASTTLSPTRSLSSSMSTARTAAGTYNAAAAVNYAANWWNGYNPAYPQYGNDCMNYVSQILHAGGVAYDIWGSWQPGYAPWYNVGYFNYWAENSGPFNVLGSVWSMRAGDAFEIAWYGGLNPDHAMAVDAVSGGIPLMTGHTNARWNYPLSTIISNYPNGTYWSFRPYGATR